MIASDAHRVGRSARLALGACMLMLLLMGCNGESDSPGTTPTPRPSTGETPSLKSVAQDLLPELAAAPITGSTNLPPRIDIPSRRPPRLLKGPPVGARLVMVRLFDTGDEMDSFDDQDAYFLGDDDQWRVLNLADLGLSARDWPGPDGSGMGHLSPAGTHWAMETTRHVVVLDLLTKKLKFHSLPGGRRPTSSGWTVRNTMLVTNQGNMKTSYELDPATGETTLIKAPAGQVTVLADGNRAIAGWKDNQPFVNYVTASNKSISRRDYGFNWETQVAATDIQRDGALFLDSLGLDVPEDFGSMVAVVDQSLQLKATLPWPKRATGDYPYGWVSDDTFLFTVGETMAAWCPEQAKIARVSAMSDELAISMAMEVVDASCV